MGVIDKRRGDYFAKKRHSPLHSACLFGKVEYKNNKGGKQDVEISNRKTPCEWI